MQAIFTKAKWLELANEGLIRPYVYARPENRLSQPGTRHRLTWFPWEPLYIDPTHLDELPFAESIYQLENKAFGPSNMPIPRWVFWDCGVMPGFVTGFAMKSSALPLAVKRVLDITQYPWVPLSLFIIIPTMKKGDWIAHNLSSINSLLDKSSRFSSLGFLTKAFGLWYANVDYCCGFTQWGTPAIKLHSHFGHMEILTAYTPVHSHAKTLTYRVEVIADVWEKFFTREEDYSFLEKYESTSLLISPTSEDSMKDIHTRIVHGEGPFYLSADDISKKNLTDSLCIYKKKGNYVNTSPRR